MKKLKTLIVDDEPLALGLVKSCLKGFTEIGEIIECRNGEDAIEQTVRHKPDLMFLDIQMPGKNGFEVIKALQNDVMPMVVFITTYPQYALDAFDLNAVDYIPKPLDEDRLRRAVQRAAERYQGAQHLGGEKMPLIGAIDEVIRKLSDEDSEGAHWLPETASPKKLIVRDSGKVIAVPELNIDWIDAAGDYMCVHAEGETHVIRSTVKQLLERLDREHFWRVHRSTIVNIHSIHSIEPLAKGDYVLQLNCGERLRVSRNYNQVVKAFASLPPFSLAHGH